MAEEYKEPEQTMAIIAKDAPGCTLIRTVENYEYFKCNNPYIEGSNVKVNGSATMPDSLIRSNDVKIIKNDGTELYVVSNALTAIDPKKMIKISEIDKEIKDEINVVFSNDNNKIANFYFNFSYFLPKCPAYSFTNETAIGKPLNEYEDNTILANTYVGLYCADVITNHQLQSAYWRGYNNNKPTNWIAMEKFEKGSVKGSRRKIYALKLTTKKTYDLEFKYIYKRDITEPADGTIFMDTKIIMKSQLFSTVPVRYTITVT